MHQLTMSRMILLVATFLFIVWTVLNVTWPVEDYANVALAYAESTNQLVRGMTIGVTCYLLVIGLVIGWHVTRPTSSER